jgi:hypothetical protein
MAKSSTFIRNNYLIIDVYSDNIMGEAAYGTQC